MVLTYIKEFKHSMLCVICVYLRDMTYKLTQFKHFWWWWWHFVECGYVHTATAVLHFKKKKKGHWCNFVLECESSEGLLFLLCNAAYAENYCIQFVSSMQGTNVNIREFIHEWLPILLLRECTMLLLIRSSVMRDMFSDITDLDECLLSRSTASTSSLSDLFLLTRA